ncbi:MAG: glycosyltransferase family 1 protein [Candidatus Dormiibacterota bacterium]
MPAAPTAKGRVLLDIRPLQGADAVRGIGTYVRGLLGGLVEEGFDNRLALLIDSRSPLPPLPRGDFVAFSVHPRYRGRTGLVEEAVTLGSKLGRIAPDLYHAPSLALPGRSPVPLVVTLHDLIPWAFGGKSLRGERVRWWLGRRLLRRADVVIAVSRHTAEDARRVGGVDPAIVTVIPEAASPLFRPREGAAERVAASHGVRPPFLFYNGALDQRKDPRGLLRAWDVVRASGHDVPLVLAGTAGAQAPQSMGDAVRVGQVTVEELADLFSAAACLVFPSRYEGFGLPPLEAMACGCPVVAYRNSSLPGVLGEAAILVEDGDSDALGRAAVRVMTDPAAADRLRRAGLQRAQTFSWRRTARETIRVYERLLGKR